MYRTMEGTHYNSPEKAIQVWRLLSNILFDRWNHFQSDTLVVEDCQKQPFIFYLVLYMELKTFPTFSRTGDQ